MHIDRRQNLLQWLDSHKTATTNQLAHEFDVSTMTIRRDINWLADRNLLVRTRDGARSVQPKVKRAAHPEYTFSKDIVRCSLRKKAIAREAASMCHDGETVIINGGTTTFMMADFLADKDLRLLTNSFSIAKTMLACSESEIILLGGKICREKNVVLAPFENDIAPSHYARKIFTSTYGLSVFGLLEHDPLLIIAEKRLINQAEDLIVLVDSSKFERRADFVLCGLDRVSCVITDTDVSDADVQMLEHRGIRVITVQPEETVHACR